MAIKQLEAFVDCVVMLTWSNWKTEPRSNRYHYASRFSRNLPVYFIQVDLVRREGKTDWNVVEERTELPNVTVWHLDQSFILLPPEKAQDIILKELQKRSVGKPLFWIYNIFMDAVLPAFPGALKVYHATEDYFEPGIFPYGDSFVERFQSLLKNVDLVVAVTEGVLDSFVRRGGYSGDSLVLLNGCDYGFYSEAPVGYVEAYQQKKRKIVLFQGGINARVDYDLLSDLVEELPDWIFHFCGTENKPPEKWSRLKRHPRVKYWGVLSAEEIRQLCYQASVGIIPYVQSNKVDNSGVLPIATTSLPIKAFEYVACGLPVVSVPIERMKEFSVFDFASTASEFAQKISMLEPTRCSMEHLKQRQISAKSMDYDLRFETLAAKLLELASERCKSTKNILVLYDDWSVKVATIKEHLESFKRHSENNVFYAVSTGDAQCPFDLRIFDAIVVHFCVRVSIENHLSPDYANKLEAYKGPKILFIQDEYDSTEVARKWIDRLQFEVVFTCVPSEYVGDIYPPERFPKTRFITVLTGAVPDNYVNFEVAPDSSTRPVLIGYRGRPLPYWYGDLGQDKLNIGIEMRRICREKGLNVDIEWESDKRIYGRDWYDFVKSCRVMLGTESGSNVFDITGDIRQNIETALRQNPELTYEEARLRFLENHEGKIVQNQISPKVFEAIAFRTGLVLFEGAYSGVIQPDIHFIALKKDYSNVAEVLAKVQDDAFLRRMTDQAYRDIIESGKYSYRSFIEEFDRVIATLRVLPTRESLVTSVVAIISNHGRQSLRTLVDVRRPIELRSIGMAPSGRYLPTVTVYDAHFQEIMLPVQDVALTPEQAVRKFRAKVLIRELLRRGWHRMPRPFRSLMIPLLRPLKKMARNIPKP